MRQWPRSAIAILSLILPLAAGACGVCIEDKVAATYDHDVVVKATREKQTVVFLEIEGLATKAAPDREWLMRTIAKTPGVERGSVRVSVEQAAVSFAIHAGKHAPVEVQKSINKNLAAHRLQLKLIRLLYQGSLSQPT
ncbi:hypothetical protein BH11PSE11_BH11PSE11_29050 [soil metagenome]